jgi:hypothetical protein
MLSSQHKPVQRVVLSMETGGKSGVLDNYLVLSGRARVTEGGAPELLHQLAQVYVGLGRIFRLTIRCQALLHISRLSTFRVLVPGKCTTDCDLIGRSRQ